MLHHVTSRHVLTLLDDPLIATLYPLSVITHVLVLHRWAYVLPVLVVSSARVDVVEAVHVLVHHPSIIARMCHRSQGDSRPVTYAERVRVLVLFQRSYTHVC